MGQPKNPRQQVSEFRKVARELGADESEARFDAMLKAVARHKSLAKPKKSKRSTRRS